MDRDLGSVKVKNVSGSPYVVEELGGYALAAGATVDLVGENTETVHRYGDFYTAKRLVESVTTAKLYRDIRLGAIELVEVRAPRDVKG
jgi:hypothetical protein